MRSRTLPAILLIAATGCSSRLVNVAPVPPAAYSEGEQTSATACGMLVFGFIPVSVNERVERAYATALEKQNATSLTDTSLTEHWYFTPFGPRLCTTVKGLALTRNEGVVPQAATPRAELRKNSK